MNNSIHTENKLENTELVTLLMCSIFSMFIFAITFALFYSNIHPEIVWEVFMIGSGHMLVVSIYDIVNIRRCEYG